MLFNAIVFLGLVLTLIGLAGAGLLTWRIAAARDDAGRLALRRARAWAFYAVPSGMVLLMVPGMLFYAEPGMSYLVQYPWGLRRSCRRLG